MAIILIEQYPLQKYEDAWVLVRPKPQGYSRRVKVHVPDDIAKNREVQPILDAYATALKKKDWIGMDKDWYREEQQLQLGFHVTSYDDGSSVEV